MAKLDDVNEMLEAIGEAPVDALDTGGTTIVAQAEAILDRTSKRIQRRGWMANTKEEELSPDGSDEIVLDADVLAVEPVDHDAWRTVAIKDGKLFNLDEDPPDFKFDNDIDLRIVHEQDLDELTEALRAYIIAEAALRFARANPGVTTEDRALQQALSEARAEARREDEDYRKTNLLETPEALNIKGMRRRRITRR